MTNRKTYAALAAAALVAASLTAASPAAAQAAPPANAHCGTSTGDTGANAWTDHAELRSALETLEAQRSDVLDVSQIGASNQGRAIWAARTGTGPKVVLITSEIHGNEKTGTDALLALLRDFTAPTPEARRLRSQVTLVAVPKMNPDAAELDRRGNDRTWAEVVADFPQLASARPAWNYYTQPRSGDDYASRPGFDVNRDYHPDLDYVPRPEDFPGSSAETGWYIHPESQAVRDLYKSLKGEFGAVDTYIDLHHQGPCDLDESGENQVTMSLSGKFIDIDNHQEYNRGYRLDYSKQLTLAAYDALQTRGESPFGSLTLYPQDIDLPGTGLGSFALNGSGTVLFEVRGQTQTWGAKQRGQLVRTVVNGLDGIIDALAAGTVTQIDPARYDDIPETQ
ncbi:peptidase M14 [Nonomuraea terrae]|uniref:Peptidase M14 n=1 Tax=Nonomuraea terrae TaxID=2530383 RepID=A0A4R4XK44_9ACTN|nr:M14 family zinc carboxypeptidase [Nonomuraea terrae]TDD30922.1 peptidase M14 [Nonomuraea terrae]